MLSSKDAGARLEAVKALSSLYAKEDNIGGMQHFTERFKGRLVEMATAEPDATVRVEAIKVLRAIDLHGLLEDEERADLTKTLFHEHRPTRNATAPFVATLLQEAYDDLRPDLQVDGASGRRGAKSTASSGTVAQAESMLHLKCLATLVARTSREGSGSNASASDDDAAADAAPAVASTGLDLGIFPSRVAAAVDALWTCYDPVKDQAGMVALLMRAEEDDDTLKLTKDEETTLLELLVESCRRAAAVVPKEADNDESPDAPEATTTRLLITELPRLLAKYLREPTRVALLLRLPSVMDLEEYVSSRKVTVSRHQSMNADDLAHGSTTGL